MKINISPIRLVLLQVDNITIEEVSQYFDVIDSIFHRNWVEFNAATDNRAKNTYPYVFGNLRDGYRFRWRGDDMDTIWPITNQGQSKKGYYVETHDTYEDGGPVWNGATSVFWNLLDAAFPEEIKQEMIKFMKAMETLSGKTDGTYYDRIYAFFDKYYFQQAQEYFPMSLYNADAKWTYEDAKWAQMNGKYSNDTDPITQSLGDHYSAERRWISKRILYMMSKYSYGTFSADGDDIITVRAAGWDINGTTGEITSASQGIGIITDYVPVRTGAKVRMQRHATGGTHEPQIAFYDENYDYVGEANFRYYQKQMEVDAPSNAKYMLIQMRIHLTQGDVNQVGVWYVDTDEYIYKTPYFSRDI